MGVGRKRIRKERSIFTVLLLLCFIFVSLPGGLRNIRAEEVTAEEPPVTIEHLAEVIWAGVPDDMEIPDTTLHLMIQDKVVESMEITDGSTEVRFSPVEKFNDAGEEILYSISQSPLEQFTTEIKGFVVENTYIEPFVESKAEEPIEEPVIEEPVEEPVIEEPVEEPVIEEPVEEPVIEEPVEEPVIEEPVEEPVIEEPVEEPVIEEPVEEPVIEEPVEEPMIEEPVEEPMIEESMEEPVEDVMVEEVNLYEPLGPDRIIPAYATSEVPTYETLGEPEDEMTTFSTRSFSPMMMTASSTFISPTQPGEVTIDKYATPVPGLVNTWDITLRIEGMDSQKSSDIVLVIDRSGSMASNDRLVQAKIAAKAFVDAMAGKPNTRIAVVSFASAYNGATTVTTNQDFTTNSTALKSAIDGLVALGGTNTQAGIRRAASLLDGSTADLKNMVLLSDGEPTQSYRVYNNNAYFEWYNKTERVENSDGSVSDRTVHFRTRSNLAFSAFDYGTTAGAGTAAYTYYKTLIDDRYYSSHGNNAISQAGMFKAAGGDRTLWTIALETTTYGDAVLGAIASPGKAYTASPGDLNTIFLEIAGSISSAARDGVISDPMGPGFEIPSWEVPNIFATEGMAVYDSVTRKITWSFNALNDEISSGSTIMYAELTYRVHITQDILDIPVTDDQHLYPTNGDTEISYKDMDGITQSMDFPIPVVNPIFLLVKKTLQDADGNVITDPLRTFPIRIVSDDTDGDTIYSEYDNIYNLKPGEEVTKTNLRLADDYTVSESAPDYDVTIMVDGVETDSFIVDPPVDGMDSDQNDIHVEVINKEKPLGKLILKKLLVDKNGDPILNDTREFTFNITGPDGYTNTKTLSGGDTEEITGLKYGDYTIWETDPGTGFTVIYDPSQGTPPPPQTEVNVTLKWDNKEETVTVTNKYESPLTDVTARKIWENGELEDHIAVTLTLYRQIGAGPKSEVTGVTPTIVPPSGTASEFVYTWSDLDKTNIHGEEYIYTVDELTVPADYEKTISPDGLTVTNTYKLTSVVVSKLVTGNMGDKTKDFTFTATLGQGAEFPELGTGYTINPNNPSEATFTLKHDEEVTLIVPIGATLTIVESDNEGYMVSINGIPVTDSEWTGTVQSEGTSIEFTNNNDVTIPNGIHLDTMPYILILIILGAASFSGFYSKRRHLNFD